MTEIHAFAHNIKNFSGHPYTYHLLCRQAVEALGGTYRAYIYLHADLPSLPEGWRRWLPSGSNKHFFRRQARRLFRMGNSQTRTFFIETFTRRELRAFALSALQYGRKEDHLWILFRDDHIMKRSKDRRIVKFYMKLLKIKFGAHLHLLTDSTAIASYLGKQLRLPLTVLPLPLQFKQQKPFAPSGTKKLLFIGEPRKEKGIHTVQKLAASNEASASHYILTCSEEISLKPLNLKVKRHQKNLSLEEYKFLIHTHDVMLLPYSSSRYERRTSGIFVEAICGGCIPLVTEGTWMSRELKEAELEELIIDFSSPNFFEKLDAILADPTIYPKLQDLQDRYLQTHTVENFTQSLNELCALQATSV